MSKVLKQPNFFHSRSSTLPKDAPAKFYPSTAFGLSFMISSVAPTRSPTFYSYLITKIGNGNLKDVRTYTSQIWPVKRGIPNPMSLS